MAGRSAFDRARAVDAGEEIPSGKGVTRSGAVTHGADTLGRDLHLFRPDRHDRRVAATFFDERFGGDVTASYPSGQQLCLGPVCEDDSRP